MSSKDRKKAKKKSERQRKVQEKKNYAETKLKMHRHEYPPDLDEDILTDEEDEILVEELEDLFDEVDPKQFESELVFSLIEYVEERDQLSEQDCDDLTDFACSAQEPTRLMDRLQGWNDPWMSSQYYAMMALAEHDEKKAKKLQQQALHADPTNLQAISLDFDDAPSSPALIEKIKNLLKKELDRFGTKLYEPDKFGSIRSLAGCSLRLMMHLSKAHYELGLHDEAILYLRQCLTIDTSKTYLRRLRLIDVLLELGRLDEAREEIEEHERTFGLGLVLPYAIALESYLRGNMQRANEFLDLGMVKNLPFIVVLINQEDLKASRAYQQNPLAMAGVVGVEVMGNCWKSYIGTAEWISERLSIKSRMMPSHSAKKQCGLCGKTRNLIKTPCCEQWICNDTNQYVMFSYARNSCSRNHERYTLCGNHFHASHSGSWKDCEQCREMGSEMYVYSGSNSYNFDYLTEAPTFKRQRCTRCQRLLDLAREGYTQHMEEYLCGDCEPLPDFGQGGEGSSD